MHNIQHGAESFLLKGGQHCVLLIHGFSGSVSEMRWLADFLHQLGYSVFAVRLPGHGTTVEDLSRTTMYDWVEAVESTFLKLKDDYPLISVVGMSMGGLLALNLATNYQFHRLIVLAAPIYIKDWRLNFLNIFRLFIKSIPKKLHNYGLENHIRYDQMPIKAIVELKKLITKTKPILPLITVPTLVMQSKVEHTLKPKSANYIYNYLGSTKKKLVWLNHSGHMLVLGAEKNLVFSHINEFLEK